VSTRRHRPGASGNVPKGPNGRGICRQCGIEVAGRRLTFCSDACVDEWKIRTAGGFAATKVRARDHGVCASCGLDCEALKKQIDEVRRLRGTDAAVLELRSRMFGPHHLRRRLWEVDHVVPVVEGGGECGLGNLRTLCAPCHKRATAELAGRRARARSR
jgi:hypothetical protein